VPLISRNLRRAWGAARQRPPAAKPSRTLQIARSAWHYRRPMLPLVPLGRTPDMPQIAPKRARDDRASKTTAWALSPAVPSPLWPKLARGARIGSRRVPMHEAPRGDPTVWQARTFVRFICLWITCLGLSACSLRGAPSYSLFGAFFPAWLLCAGIGLLGSVVLRVLVIALGFEEALPSPLLVYTAFATGVALWLWLALFGEH
jgi:hypothetical protein